MQTGKNALSDLYTIEALGVTAANANTGWFDGQTRYRARKARIIIQWLVAHASNTFSIQASNSADGSNPVTLLKPTVVEAGTHQLDIVEIPVSTYRYFKINNAVGSAASCVVAVQRYNHRERPPKTDLVEVSEGNVYHLTGDTALPYLPGEEEMRELLDFLASTHTVEQALMLYGDDTDWNDSTHLKDWSGDARHALVKASPCPIFTASGGLVSSVGTPLTAQGAFTFMCRCRFDAIDTTLEILSTGTTNDLLRVDSSGNLLFIEARSSGFVQASSAVVINTNYHLAFTYDGSTSNDSPAACSTVKLYKDGALIRTGSSNGTNWTNPYNNDAGVTMGTFTSWRLGARGDGTLPFKGKIWDARMYASVLSDANILACANGTPVAGAVRYWPLQERNGTIAYDAVGNGNLTYTGTFTWGTQDSLHHNVRRGCTIYLKDDTTNTYAFVPNKEDGTQLSHTVPGSAPFGSNSNLVRWLGPSRRGEGIATQIDFTNAGANSGLGLESGHVYGTARTSPRAIQFTESAIVTAARAGSAKIAVYYGTSLTAGGGGAWATDISAWLNDRNAFLTSVNNALSGQQSSWGVANLATEVIAENPDFVFLESFAMNDADNQLPVISVAQHRTNVESMIDTILADNANAIIYLLTMNPTTGVHANGNARHPNLPAYYQEDRDIVADYDTPNVVLLDINSYWIQLSQAVLDAAITDGVHPTSAASTAHIVPFLKGELTGEERFAYLFSP